jgi:hypothetical protein
MVPASEGLQALQSCLVGVQKGGSSTTVVRKRSAVYRFDQWSLAASFPIER